MGAPVRWGWRIAFAAIWLLLTASWLFLPTLGRRGNSFDVPFLEISLFQTPSAIVVSPTTDEAVPLRVLDDMIAGFDIQIAELEEKIKQPLPPEFRNRGLIKILFGPPSPRRLWRYQITELSRNRKDANQAIDAMLSAHVDSLLALQAEVEALLPKVRGRAAIFGPLTAFVQPTAPVLPSAVYIARTPLLVVAALSVLPLVAGVIQSIIGRGVRPRTPEPNPADGAKSASDAALAAAARGGLIRRPRWYLRLGIGLAVTVGGFFIAHWATTDRVFQFQLRASDDLRFRVEHNCFLVGHFFDTDWREKYAQQAYQAATAGQPAPLLSKLTPFFEQRFWTYEPANALRAVSQRALTRGAAFLQDGYQTVVALGGWVAGLPGLLFLVPILTGLITEARMSARRRRGVCAACAYPMFGLPEPRCPECGLVERHRAKPKLPKQPAAVQTE